MKQRIFSIALALCLCISNMPVSYASGDGIEIEEDNIQGEDITPPETPSQTETSEQDETKQGNLEQAETPDEETKQPEESELDDPDPENPEEGEEPFIDAHNDDLEEYADSDIPSVSNVYQTLIDLQNEDRYKEGTPWDDNNQFYKWNGGPVAGNITSGTGCAAFAFELSDKAFGALPARTLTTGNFKISDVRSGDILRVNNNSHSVIVLQATDAGVIVAEGNYHVNGGAGMVHWGRVLTAAEVEAATFFITRYPANYVDPDDENANVEIDSGTTGNLTWKLTSSGVLTISGNGDMGNYSSADATPWSKYMNQIMTIVIESGATNVGDYAFSGCNAISVSIPNTVKAIGSHAFYAASLVSVSIPGSVETIGSHAFQNCQNIVSATIAEGVKTLEDSAFYGCTSLTSIVIPSSVLSVGAAAFQDCEKMTSAAFRPSSSNETVTMGDYMFARCRALNSVVLPQKIDCISTQMFMDCLTLSTFTVPEGTTIIKNQAFASCPLTSIYIPVSMAEFELNPFPFNVLQDVYFGGDQAAWTDLLSHAAVTIKQALANAEIHYNSTPEVPSVPDEHVHHYTTAWSSDSAYHWHECIVENCDITTNSAKDSYAAHTWETVTNEDGNQQQVCSVCAYVQTSDGNDPENPDTPDTPENPDTPNTPDTPSTPGNSGSNSGSSSSGGGTAIKPATPSTSTTENTDGSITTVKTDERTGTVTETTTNPDGSKTVVATQTDGTVTTTETDSDGNRTETVDKPDGSSTIVVDQSDGTTASVTIDATGKVDAEVSLPSSVVNEAQQTGEAVPLPIPEVRAPKNTSSAPTVTVKTGSAEPVKVTIPVVDPGPGDVAILVRTDGSEEILKTSVPVANGVAAALPDGATVKIVDNSKDFSDVTAQHWAADTIDFVSARELFTGTTPTTFTPDAPMTRAMLITVLARFDGADTAGGSTWYEKGVSWAVSKGVSDGSAPEQNITREQLVVMLWRYAGSPAAGNTLSGFTDAGKVSDYAQQAMSWAVENGIISGFVDGTLGPNGEASRAQVAQILKNFIAQGV